MATLTITLSLPLNDVERILHIITERHSLSAESVVNPCPEPHESALMPQQTEAKSESADRRAREFASLLTRKTAKVVGFVVTTMGRLNNDDLAQHLGFTNAAYTSSLLGKVTWALRKIGVRADGRNGVNWYQKRKVGSRTVLLVRADVLEVFKSSLAFIQSDDESA